MPFFETTLQTTDLSFYVFQDSAIPGLAQHPDYADRRSKQFLNQEYVQIVAVDLTVLKVSLKFNI